MKITKTSNEIVTIVNETIGMDICHVDFDDDIKIDAMNDVEGNRINFHDYLFCSDSIYHYVNQQGTLDGILYFTLNCYPVNNSKEYDYKCINIDGEHDDFCTYSVNVDDIGMWTFDEETFINMLEGLKIVFKVKTQPFVILDDDEEFIV